MALISSDQITITDIRDSISCEISSSNGVSLLDASQGTILTCHLYGADGEIDIEDENEENLDGEYLYFWTKKETDESVSLYATTAHASLSADRTCDRTSPREVLRTGKRTFYR